jgi:hypothetical protein
MKHLKKFNESDYYKNEIEIKFTHKLNRNLDFSVYKSPDGRVTRIGHCHIRFPFSVGQMISRNIEVWACNNNFMIDGKDTCPEKKVFGIKVSDIPQGHEFRKLYPNKFK